MPMMPTHKQILDRARHKLRCHHVWMWLCESTEFNNYEWCEVCGAFKKNGYRIVRPQRSKIDGK